MMKSILVAPSILSSDFTKLGEEVKRIEDAGADIIHIDVMDGHFVPNITIGPLIVEAVKRKASLPLDVHLMIENPHRLIKEFADAGADIISVHAEAYPLGEPERAEESAKKGTSRTVDKIDEERIKETLGQIKSLGKKAGLALNPDTPFSSIENVVSEVSMVVIMSVHPGFGGQVFIEKALPKIKEAREAYAGDIEVDGGINSSIAGPVIEAGANVIVAGSYFFGAEDRKEAVRKLRALK